MSSFNLKNLNLQFSGGIALVAALCVGGSIASAATYTVSVFATGTAVGSTAPDSVTYGGGSVWIEYGNGASSSNYTGTSTIVRYSTSGSIQDTYQIAGSVDGLKYNSASGQVWALQNQDGNSKLSVIDPATKVVTQYTYGTAYGSPGTRGFDDVAFIGNKVFLSETNPASTSDPVVLQLNNTALSSPLNLTTIQTGAGILATDPDSLKATPFGGLVLTGEGDEALTFISNLGLSNQTASSLLLSGASGTIIGKPDDSLYVTSSTGIFYVADTTANTVYAISGAGLATNSLFVSVGTEFGSVDPNTGVITNILSGTGIHGADFVATPEPGTLGLALTSLLGIAVGCLRRKSACE